MPSAFDVSASEVTSRNICSNERRTEEENRNLLQEIGNNSNAYTFPYHTAYFVNTTPENLDKAADLVAGWMLTATTPQNEFEREREVVQRELEKDMGEPDWVMYHLSQTTRYIASPAKVPTIGYQEVIKSLPAFRKRMRWFLDNRPELARNVCYMERTEKRR